MKKIDVLAWGVRHIAHNHRDAVCNTDYKECMSMSIVDDSVPTLSDTQMLCEDLGIERQNCYADHSWGVICIDLEGWVEKHGQEEYVPTGMEMWKRYGVEIGSPIEAPAREKAETVPAVEPVACTGDVYVDLPF